MNATPKKPAAPPPPPSPAAPPPLPPRARKRARSPFRWLRRFLLLAGLFGLAALGVILAAYQFGQSADLQPATGDSEIGDPDAVTTGENITYVQTSGGEVVFQVEAARSIEERSGRSHLEDVSLTVPRQDGEAYRIDSDIAWVDQEKHEARLEGDVRITGWSDLVVETRRMDVLQQGQLMVSRGEVRFSYPPNLMGRASEMRIDKRSNTVILSRGVHLHSTPGAETPMRLDCQRLVFKRSEGLIRAVDRVVFQFGEQHLRTHYLSLFLNEDRSLRTLQARWRIHGGFLGTDEAGGIRHLLYHGQFLEIEPSTIDPENRSVILRGTPEEPAAMSMRLADGLGRDVVAQEIQARVLGGDLSSVEATGTPLVLDEFLTMPGRKFPLRKICARRLVAGFGGPQNDLTQLYMEEQVELSDRDLHLSGGRRAVVDVARGSFEIDGPQVTMSNDRGDLTAPQIRYSQQTGLLKATGGVQAALAENAASALAGSPLGAGDGPINVQSKEAHWTEAPPGFVFREDVRAWRGQNLLLAQQLRGDEASGEMAASGQVTTVWKPERSPVVPGATAASSEPIEVTAATVSFRRTDNRLIYAGGVRLVQAGRSLTCNELAVDIESATGGAEHMQCRGDVELVDPIGGRTVTGQSAEYEVAAGKIEVLGDPVRLIDAERQEMLGGYLRYDLDSGRTRLSARPPSNDATGSP